MHRVKEIIQQVADTDVTVLILGESRVGKEVADRYLHRKSNRWDKALVKVNCAALPDELLESKLFGYERGVFTEACRQKLEEIDLPNAGTLFLDEIAEISPPLQAKLLQVLQDHEFPRLGEKKNVGVDVRVLAATNQNLEEAMKTGRFREDLYYRLSVVEITLPPLRDRKEQVPLLAEYYLTKLAEKYRRKMKSLSDSFRQSLMA